jgi:MFS family permease
MHTSLVFWKVIIFIYISSLSLGASYMIGRGLASVFWGIIADRIGRKPVIAFSVFSV